MKPELLAPAGSIESFHAALSAGADAVYLGLADFNARLRARNFTVKTLSYLVPYAHLHNVKLYVTLNTLVKQAELEPVIHTLYQLEQIGVDALIVADCGLIDIARKHFPRLRLHASTQMTIHNSAGVHMAQRLGLKRVILSRECTLDEIGSIKKQAAIELEIFIHGALCYSVSGLCLASSFLGGSSGNRGRCTQVCRRKFKTNNAAGYFFSPNDLSAIDFLPRVAGLGIASLKIEGRMKGPEYVYTVVSAYRKVIDGTISVEEARALLRHDLAREKCSLFLGGVRQAGIIEAAARSGVGELIGTVIEAGNDLVVVASERTCAAGDRIRIQPKSGFEGTAAVIRSIVYEPGVSRLRLKTAVECAAGDTVYLIGRQGEGARFDRKGVTGVEPAAFTTRCSFVNKIMQNYSKNTIEGAYGHGRLRRAGALVRSLPPLDGGRRVGAAQRRCAVPAGAFLSHRDTLWIKVDTVGWLDQLVNTPCQRLIFAGDRQEAEKLLGDEARLKQWRSRLLIGLPPFIPEQDITGWQSLAGRFKSAGINSGACANIGHQLIFPKGFQVVADYPLGCLNRASQTALKNRGFSGFIYSYEDDYLNIKASASASASGEGIACLFSNVPLFISRIHPAVRSEDIFSDPHGNRFVATEGHGLFYLLSKEPFCITHRRRKLSEAGIHDFLIDLTFCRPDTDILPRLIDCYTKNTRMPETGLFNFKAGLR
jgi:U32 family peptidase